MCIIANIFLNIYIWTYFKFQFLKIHIYIYIYKIIFPHLCYICYIMSYIAIYQISVWVQSWVANWAQLTGFRSLPNKWLQIMKWIKIHQLKSKSTMVIGKKVLWFPNTQRSGELATSERRFCALSNTTLCTF